MRSPVALTEEPHGKAHMVDGKLQCHSQVGLFCEEPLALDGDYRADPLASVYVAEVFIL